MSAGDQNYSGPYINYASQNPFNHLNQSSHVTHSWQNMMGDPFAGVTASMNRLAAALEKFNERK